ncbi:MAG: hypothetical protein QM645_13480 [Asticcacaulis sp.]
MINLSLPDRFTRGLKPLALTLLMVAGSGLTAVNAQQAQPNDKNRERGQKEAPALIAATGATCDVSDTFFVGESKGKNAEGKNTKTLVYEVACNGGPGYILSQSESISEALTCTQAHGQNAADPSRIKCVLPGNQPHHAWLNTLIQTKTPDCTVADARWLGSVPDQKFDRYEYSCTDKAGAIVDVPQAGSSYPLTLTACLLTVGTSSACTLNSAEQVALSLSAQAKQASATCQVNNARWLGRIAADNTDYYEIGCANEPGFLVATDMTGAFKSTVGCDRAGTLGPCQYTDSAALEQVAKDGFTATLKAAGQTCTVTDFNVYGTQTNTNRDLIEFKCAEQTYGLMGFIPNQGSTSQADVFDCYTAAGRNRACEYVAADVLVKNIDALTKAENKDCDVQEVRYAGIADEGAVIVEIACTNKRGYIADLLKSRKAFGAIVSCNIAKSRGYETCSIPGNGTYVSAVGQD